MLTGLKALNNAGIEHPAIAVVVNRVARAREVFEQLRNAPELADVELILMIGPSRSVDRDQLAKTLQPIRTGDEEQRLERPLVIVSTQCIEAGVDIDLDGLVQQTAIIVTVPGDIESVPGRTALEPSRSPRAFVGRD